MPMTDIIQTLRLLKAEHSNQQHRAALGCAIQIIVGVVELQTTVDIMGKEFYYATHPTAIKQPKHGDH